MTGAGLRIGVVGATGALGGEVLALLDASGLRVAEIVPLATDRSLGEEVEFQGEAYPVIAERPPLRGLDLLFCCAPAAASLEWVREALRAQVPCIDCSGAVAHESDVPMRVAVLPAPAAAEGAPLVTTPPGAVLVWSLVLAPLARAAGLRRVVGTVLETAGATGRDAIAALSLESLALFNQQELDDRDERGRPLAFDCHPALGTPGDDGRTPGERDLETGVQRLLGARFPVAATIVQVPAFVGQASVLAVETERPLDPKEAEDLLARAEGVEVWTREREGPNLRAAAGRERVIAGRIRRDPSVANGLQLWLAADALRLSAANAVALAVARFRAH